MNEKEYRLAAVMFTDIYGFSRMMEKDEKHTITMLQKHNTIIKDYAQKYNGHIIKTIGDAFLVDFNNTSNAVQCALKVQEDIDTYNHTENKGDKLFVRIGVHLGDIWFFENDAFGDSINIASRLQTLARPGRVCISSDVYNQVVNKVNDVDIISLGKAKLKNITKEVRAYEILTSASKTFEKQQIENENMIKEALNSAKKTASDEKEEVNEAEIKDHILKTLRVGGKRISIDGFQSLFEISEKNLATTLHKMTEAGLLTKIEKEDGEVEFGIGSFKKLISKHVDDNKDFFNKIAEHIPEKEREEIKESIKDAFKQKHKQKENIKTPAQTPGKKIKKNKKTAKYRIQKLIKKVNGVIYSFIPNIVAYPIITTICYFINKMFTPNIPWFIFPLVFGGIGTINHLITFLFALKQRDMLHDLPEPPNDEHYRYIKQYMEVDTKFMSHVSSFTFFNGIFLLCNIFTHPDSFRFITNLALYQKILDLNFMQTVMEHSTYAYFTSLNNYWFLYPLGLWGALLAIHYLLNTPFQVKLTNQIKNVRIIEDAQVTEHVEDSPQKTSPMAKQPVDVDQPSQHRENTERIDPENQEMERLVEESYSIKNHIIEKINNSEFIKDKLDSDIEDLIDSHILEIKKLKERNEQLAVYLRSYSSEDLEKKLEDFRDRRDKTKHEDIKNEYKNTISQLEKQKESYEEIEIQKEMIYLKFTSSVMSLKQLEMEIMRMKELYIDETETSIKLFEERSRDLSKYVDNLKASYQSLENIESERML